MKYILLVLLVLLVLSVITIQQQAKADDYNYIHNAEVLSSLLPDSAVPYYANRAIIRIKDSSLLAVLTTSSALTFYYNIFVQSDDNGKSWYEVIKWSDEFAAGLANQINGMDYNNKDIVIVANSDYDETDPKLGRIYKLYLDNYTIDTLYTGYSMSQPKVKFLTDSLVYIASRHGIIYSEDCGNTWNEVKVLDGNKQQLTNFYSYQIIDKNHFYLVKYVTEIEGRKVYFIRTTDGGDTWKTTEMPIDIDAVDFLDSNIGWMAGRKANSQIGGDTADFSFNVYKTEDGGDTWISKIDSTFNFLTSNFTLPNGFVYIKFYNENVGIFHSLTPKYMPSSYTLDGGMTWKRWRVPTSTHSVFFLNEFDILFLALRNLNLYNLKIDPASVETDYIYLYHFKIFPNPATDYIYINFNDLDEVHSPSYKSGLGSVRIYNTLGQCVSHLTPTLSKGEGVRIDVSQLPPGVYFVHVGNKVEKFVKWW